MSDRPLLLGAIADDLTGASDLALMLSKGGMRVRLLVGLPDRAGALSDAEAVVVALKTRTIPAAEAVAQSSAAARLLRTAGAGQLFFKYCSTFDSTDAGNIGPVIDALLDLLGADRTIACPAFPGTGRTVYMGHLFVGTQLLSESGMENHPLTPMRDANLVRLLARQGRTPVRLVPHSVVSAGGAALRTAIEEAPGCAIVDALSAADLRRIGAAVRDLPLVTGGSGMALGLPANFGVAPPPATEASVAPVAALPGRSVVLAGSCSTATRRQVAHALQAGVPALRIHPDAIAREALRPEDVVDFAAGTDRDATPLIYSSADPGEVAGVQDRIGRDRAGALVEAFLCRVAQGLRGEGFTRFILAGGETSGAVLEALGVRSLDIGPEIDPGVAWCRSAAPEPGLALALKSGNFGRPGFFTDAWRLVA